MIGWLLIGYLFKWGPSWLGQIASPKLNYHFKFRKPLFREILLFKYKHKISVKLIEQARKHFKQEKKNILWFVLHFWLTLVLLCCCKSEFSKYWTNYLCPMIELLLWSETFKYHLRHKQNKNTDSFGRKFCKLMWSPFLQKILTNEMSYMV